jgi:hypothetical protein
MSINKISKIIVQVHCSKMNVLDKWHNNISNIVTVHFFEMNNPPIHIRSWRSRVKSKNIIILMILL